MVQRKGSEYAGLSVAIITPLRDNVLDVPRLREQVEFRSLRDTNCIVPVGTTGESPTLSHEEHERVISEVVQIAAGRVKVMAGTGSNSTAEAMHLTRWAKNEGADASLQVAPYYNKPTQEGFYQHFKAIAEDVDLPICVYNILDERARTSNPRPLLVWRRSRTLRWLRRLPVRSISAHRFSTQRTLRCSAVMIASPCR